MATMRLETGNNTISDWFVGFCGVFVGVQTAEISSLDPTLLDRFGPSFAVELLKRNKGFRLISTDTFLAEVEKLCPSDKWAEDTGSWGRSADDIQSSKQRIIDFLLKPSPNNAECTGVMIRTNAYWSQKDIGDIQSKTILNGGRRTVPILMVSFPMAKDITLIEAKLVWPTQNETVVEFTLKQHHSLLIKGQKARWGDPLKTKEETLDEILGQIWDMTKAGADRSRLPDVLKKYKAKTGKDEPEFLKTATGIRR